MRFSDAAGASRNASYLNVIRSNYYNYLNSSDNPAQKQRQLYNAVTIFLNDQYRYNTSFLTTMIYFDFNPEEIYFTYSNIKSGTFDRVKQFKNTALEQVQEGAENLDTGILFLEVKDNLYMVRNMMTSKFRPFAVITMELDKEAMFKSLESIVGYQGYEVYVDGKVIADTNTVDKVCEEYRNHSEGRLSADRLQG